jgi:hypothetical protein
MASVYQIGIQIALQGTIQQQLAALGTQFLGIHTTAQNITNQFGKWATVLGGVAAVLGGSAILGAMKTLVEHGSKLNHEMELMKISGMEMGEILEANAKAAEVASRIQTTTEAENRRHIRELRMAFGDTESAMKFLEPTVRAQAIINAVTGKQGDQVWEGVKGLEMKGATMRPGEYEGFLADLTAAVVASGGKINFADFFGTFKYGRTATYGWNEEFVTKYLPTLIQEMKGGGTGGTGGPGNALMTMYQQVVSGMMTKAAAQEFQRLGLLTDQDFKPEPGTFLGKVSEFGVTGTRQFMQNPYQWVQDVLVPALKAHGYNTQEEMAGEVARLFRPRTAGAIATLMATQGSAAMGPQSRMEKDAALIRAVMADQLAYGELSNNDFQTNMLKFTQQWERLLQVLGDPLVLPATHILGAITDAISAVAKAAGEHPEALKVAMEVLLGGALGLLATGLTAIGMAIAPLVGVGGLITMLAAALGALSALNWDWIKSLFVGPANAAPGASTPTAPIEDRPAFIGPHTGKRGYNAVPPPARGGRNRGDGNVYLDGKKVGEILTGQMARMAGGPLEGSAYFDGTWNSPASDLSLSYG